MTTPQKPIEREMTYAAEQFNAEVREAEAKLKAMEAQARAHNARAEMDEISGLTAAKEKVKQQITDMKHGMSTNAEAAKRGVQQGLASLKADIQRAHDRYSAWDAARERELNARLDEADARLKVWMAQADQGKAEFRAKRQGDLALLKEKIALGRERAKAARTEQSAKAKEAAQEAAAQLEKAYHTAEKHFEQT